MAQYPVTTTLAAPTSEGAFALNPQFGSLNLDYAGGGNFFPFAGTYPLDTTYVDLGSLYIVSAINFLIRIEMFNGVEEGNPIPAPSALVCAASFSTDTNGVVAAITGLQLSNYFSLIGGNATYDFQGTFQPPNPITVDLRSNAVLNILVGVQLPTPILPAGTPNDEEAQPYMVNYTSTGDGMTTGVQVAGVTIKDIP